MTVKADLAVKYMPVGGLEPYAKNSRTHSEKQVEQIAASITEFGFTNPVLVDGADGIIAGHGRLLAAKLLGMAEVPTIELAGLSAAQKRAYIIAGEMTGRHIYAIELSPAYVDVAVKRWQDFTGQQAALEGDGRTFDEVGDARYDPTKDGHDSYYAAVEAKRQKVEAT